jgi:dienelactone hydrolase
VQLFLRCKAWCSSQKNSRFKADNVLIRSDMKKFALLMAAVTMTLLGISIAPQANAALVAQPIVYEIEGKPYEGYWVQNEGLGENQPVVLLIHDWDGLGEYEKRRANLLATKGYSVFVPDLYGQGIRPETTEESQEQSGKLYDDRETMRQRLAAGLRQAQEMPRVNPDEVAAIGYCFGGSAVLEMARAAADLDGFVVFHGGLETPEGQDYTQVQAPILILHGSDDSVAPLSQLMALAAAMDSAGVDYTMEIYGGAKHAFTLWDSESRYDPQADLKSWDQMLDFLDEVLD